MSDITFWLLDITYGIVGGTPEIKMFGIDENGERVLVLDRSFRPYYYALPKENVDVNELVLDIRRRIEHRGAIGFEVCRKKLFGKDVNVIKITVTIPEKVRELREITKQIDGVADVLEADIRFYMRYMIDMQIKPSSWITIDKVEEVKNPGYQVDKVYLIKSKPRLVEEHKIPKFKILTFDIEVLNPRGMPNPERDPIIIIGYKTNIDNEVKILTSDDFGGERNMIKEFVNIVKTFDPDIILTYNGNNFDWPYLVRRSERIGIRLDISRIHNPPEQSVYGHWSIIGRANLDLYNLIEDMPDIKIKSLDYVAEYFGIMSRSERVLIPGHRIYEYWIDKKKRNLLIEYTKADVECTYRLGEKLLLYAIQLSSISGLPLDQVGSASVGSRVEWLIMYKAYVFNELIPNREERPYETYRGAIVLEPRTGIHENIAVLDFSSMYPNIMMKYNVSPDTYIESIEDNIEYFEAPEVHHKFRKYPKGLYPTILEELIEARKRIRELLKKIPEDSSDWVILDERQKALKIMANAMYGYCGWQDARWYKREVAEAITAWGRSLLKTAIEIAKKLGLEVIYGDTDSLFVKYDKDKVEKLITYIENELGFDIKIEKIYKRVLFTEAKKRYVGLTIDGKIDIVGFEAARRDWAEIAKDTQEKVVEIILKTGDVKKAVEYAHSVIQRLKQYKFNIDEVIVWRTLEKNLNEYKALMPHVVAAKKLKELGYRVGKGDTIGYVIVKGGSKIAYRAVPYIMIKDLKEIDINYYIEHQVLPAVLRILEVLGVKPDQIISGKLGKSILDFM